MKTTTLLPWIMCLALIGCSEDQEKPLDGSISDTGAADVALADQAAADKGSGSDAQADTSTVDTSTADTGGASADASAGAIYFCNGFKSICGFGPKDFYSDMATCLKQYDSYSPSRITCVANELGKKNCKAAAGGTPCDKN